MTRQRLLKSHLVRKGWEYNEVYNRGKRLHGEGFSLICLSNSYGFSRLGISIHRKIKGAVKRNRIKRIIRESFRTMREHYPENMDIVFTVRPGFSYKNPDEICRAVERLSTRLVDVCGKADETI
ncbi:MAG: ribonuclease P protein component [Desulfobacterales bacterium]|nr:MAG: ribonuclease P protein component [Desulfobacterales bacterium]